MKKTNWINLLLQNGGNVEELENIRTTSHTELFALCKYKKVLRSRGNGKVALTEIESSYNENDISKLQNVFNKLFLEYFTKIEIDNLLKLMKETGTSISEIYNRHIENPEATLLSHITLLLRG